MKKLVDKANVDAASSTWPYGTARDKTPTVAGSKWDMEMMSDILQFFEKMFADSGLTANDLPDNADNGFQLYQALRPAKEYKAVLNQTGTGAPTATVLGHNTLGSIVWSRTGAGDYLGTLSGAFPDSSKVFLYIKSGIGGALESQINVASANTIQIQNYVGGAQLDSMSDVSVLIEVYP